MSTAKGREGFTFIETMLLTALLIVTALGIGGMLYRQKQTQVGTQQSLVGRKVLTEAISKLQAATWQYPFFVVKDSSVTTVSLGMAGAKSALTLSYITCFDRAGSPVASTQGDLKPVAVAVDNRAVNQEADCVSTEGLTGVGFGGGGTLGSGVSACSAAAINATFKLSGMCTAPAAEFEVQVTPLVAPMFQGWNGAYDVWVISLLTDEQRQQKGAIRHYFREQVLIEQ